MGDVSGPGLIVHLPAIPRLRWRVGLNGAWALPGEYLPAAPGKALVTILAEFAAPRLGFEATIYLPVRIATGGITEVRLARAPERCWAASNRRRRVITRSF